MAKEEGDFANAEGDAGAPPKKALDLQTLLLLGNTLLVLGALGTMVYTKLMYQRPPIVEEEELKKQVEEIKKPVVPAEKAIVSFDPMTINIAMAAGKAHFATVALSVECRDAALADNITAKKAQFLDMIITAVGKRQLAELNTIQGKLLLKTELMRLFNKLLPDGGITDIYFATFVLQ